MTREEAIKELKELRNEWSRHIYSEGVKKQISLDMAIKALEQEPNSDIRFNGIKDELNRVKDELEPTADNDLVVDCVSRQAVIEITAETGALETQARVKALPSVTPQEPRKDEVILTKEEYGELVSSEFDNGYAKGYREALEQEPILDKIRAEIQDTGAYEQEVNGKTEFLKGIIYCLNIIDKYKAESEEWTSDGTFSDSIVDRSEPQTITIDTPKGQLVIETKDIGGDYSGVHIQLRTGKDTNMLACVEYIKSDDEICIKNYSGYVNFSVFTKFCKIILTDKKE